MCTSIRRKFLMFHFLQCVEMGKKLRFLRKVERATFFPSNHRFDLKRSVEFTENLDGKVVKNALTVLRKIQHFFRQINVFTVFTKELISRQFLSVYVFYIVFSISRKIQRLSFPPSESLNFTKKVLVCSVRF